MLSCKGKEVPSSCLYIRLALRREDGTEGFRVMNQRNDIDQDSGQSGVILLRGSERSGEGGEMIRCPLSEPGPRTLVRAQQYRDSRDLRGLHRDRLEECKDVFAISCNFICRVVRRCGFIRRLVVNILGVILV